MAVCLLDINVLIARQDADHEHHHFLPDEISLLDTSVLPSLRGVGARALTDLYLLALTVHHGAWFATLDARFDPALVPGGALAYQVIP
jgi:hypothetical protein